MIKLNKNYKNLIVRILEDIGKGNTPKCKKYSISKECFGSILSYIKDKDLARGVAVVRSDKENNLRKFGCMNPYLTINGLNYLNRNL